MKGFKLGLALLILGCNSAIDEEKARTTKLFKEELTRFIQKSLATLPQVPGVSVAVVKDGKILLAEGFGYLNSDKTKKSDLNSRYYIASSTKSFTALAALLMHNQGTLNLDKSIAEYFPEVKFKYGHEFDPDKITLRHLITHTSGIENPALETRLAYTGQHTPEKLRELIQYTTGVKNNQLGEFLYTNFGYNLLAIIMEDVTGKAWQQILNELIYQPLGMKKTTNYMSQVQDDFAGPHDASLPAPHRVSLVKTDQSMHSAGGTLSTANDAAKWLQVQLGLGQLDGKQIFPKQLIEMSRQRLTSVNKSFGDYQRDHYGFGWHIGKYLDFTMIHHFGSYPGHRAHISFMPDRNIGVAVFTNEEHAGFKLADLIANYAYSWWLKPEKTVFFFTEGVNETFTDELEDLKEDALDSVEDRLDYIKAKADREWMLTLPLDAYTGTYSNPIWGTFEITIENNTLKASIGNQSAISSPIEKSDRIRVELVPRHGVSIAFKPVNGKVDRLRFKGENFNRQP